MIDHPAFNLGSFTPRMQAVLRESAAVTDLNQVQTNGVEPTEEPGTDGGSNPPASTYPRIPWTDDSISVMQGVTLLPEQTIVESWMSEAGRNDPIIHMSEGRIDGGNTTRGAGHYIYMDPHSNLIAAANDGTLYRIGCFTGSRRGMQSDPHDGSCFLVNDNDHGQEWVNQLVTRVWNRVHGSHPTIRVPFAALNGAGIDLDSIRIVFGDRNYVVYDRMWIPPFTFVASGQGGPTRFQIGEEYPRMAHEWSRWEGQFIWQIERPDGQWVQWQRTNTSNLVWSGGAFDWHTRIPPSFVFWGTAANGRHQYISAYDHLENPPTYFLAQLPEEVTDLAQAFYVLMPPIVRQAIHQGREVRRHGDIFFIRLYTSPEQWRDRRRDPRGRFASSRPEDFVIYNTGHTAERISVQESGATMVSGRIRHEPWLVDLARTVGDHRDLVLPRGWYLAVRNTVPA